MGNNMMVRYEVIVYDEDSERRYNRTAFRIIMQMGAE